MILNIHSGYRKLEFIDSANSVGKVSRGIYRSISGRNDLRQTRRHSRLLVENPADVLRGDQDESLRA